MLEEVLDSMHNWFDRTGRVGEFHIVNGTLADATDFLTDGQYFRVIGSVFNDGLHRWPTTDLVDEEFDGEVWALAVPKAVVDLAAEISEWCKANPPSPYTSESFGGYSYTKASAQDGAPLRWQDVFRRKLDRWRRLPC